MIVNGVIISNDKNKIEMRLKNIEKKAQVLKFVKGSGLKILK